MNKGWIYVVFKVNDLYSEKEIPTLTLLCPSEEFH